MKQFLTITSLATALMFTGCFCKTRTFESDPEPVVVKAAPAPAPKVEVVAVPKVDVIILPQSDGEVGKVVVSDNDKTTMLDQAFQKVETKHLEEKEILSQEAVKSQYGELLNNLPEKPHSYRMYFKYDSTDIASDSNILAQIVEDIKSNPTLQVDVIGCTDRAGDDAYNKILAMKRAQKVEELLKNAGIDSKLISLDYYGEENPIVATEDGVANELNRRVEITLK